MMGKHNHSAVFVTFSGNCKKALTFYQTLFGGQLRFETFDRALEGFTGAPVINGSLVSERLTIHGSDLVHEEGRKPGNHIAVFVPCQDADERGRLAKGLAASQQMVEPTNQQLVELTDAFEVRWVLGIP